MQFGMYLVENGVITCEDFYEALKLQLGTRPQLGALAIEKRKLTMRQVLSVLQAQSDTPDEKFGELALKRGYLTEADLAWLLHEQSVRVKPFGELLVDMGVMSADEMERHYREYRQALEPTEDAELMTTA